MKLTLGNKDKFFDKVEIGANCTYSETFLLEDVKRLAEEKGCKIKYNPPESQVYKKLGSLNFTVLEKEGEQGLATEVVQPPTERNLIVQQFQNWIGVYKETTDSNDRRAMHQRMVGFIIALELSGKNIDAQSCKDLYEKVSGM